MNILFVVDEFPFPPRNGVTIPVANLIAGFVARGIAVDILFMDVSGEGVSENICLSSHVNKIFRISLKRSSKFLGLVKEIFCYSALFEAWRLDEFPRGGKLSNHYDVIWTSPIRAHGLWLKFRGVLGISGDITVAGINDSYALTLAQLSSRSQPLATKILTRFRAKSMIKIEKDLLLNADIICVQSRREIDYFTALFGGGIAPRLLELKNGVANNFFRDRFKKRYDLLFVGTLDAFYRPMLEWFIDEVYRTLPEPRPSFQIVGKGASEEDLHKFSQYNISYLSFVDDITSVYLSSTILVAPVFKGYGTINKVIEAMASGCVVVGDRSAFNGLESFVPGAHGLVADTPEEFASAISYILSDRDEAMRIGNNARKLIKKDFSWDNRIDVVLDLFKKRSLS